ncbi:ABC transporter permease [bacterium]|nr:ABC transporter permease [bacterium]
MFKNYLKIPLRHLLKYKGYSLIKIMGLALGMACCALILLYVQDELRYDRYHEKADQIYRVAMEVKTGDKLNKSATTAAPMGTAILNEYPEVVEMVRLFPLLQKTLVSYEEKRFFEEAIIVADASLLEVFSFPLVLGNAKTALHDPNTILITERIAEKYFGDGNPLGKNLTFREETPYRVAGVLKNISSNSHFQFDMVLPLSPATIARFQYEDFLEQWWDWSCYNYLLLQAGQSPIEWQRKFPALIEKYIAEQYRTSNVEVTLFLQPLTEIYLKSHLNRELGANSHIIYIYIFTAIAVLILLISIINFVNLCTARSLVRAKEVFLRKAVGAQKRQLLKQFLAESILLSFVALSFALILIQVFLPHFNDFTYKELTLHDNLIYLISMPIMTTFLGLLAGIYPAIVISSFDPLTVLKGNPITSAKGGFLRQALVISQFVISIILIVAMLIVNEQKEYLKNKTLGFNKEQIIIIKLNDLQLRWQSEAIKSELLRIPNVSQATFSQTVPGLSKVKQGYGVKGSQSMILMNTLLVDDNFLRTYDIELVAGRDFSAEMQTDRTSAFIINEDTAKQLGWRNPLGKELKWGVTQKTGTVIGVVDDFHFRSLYHRIEPLVLHIEPIWFRHISVRTASEDFSRTLKRLEEVWHQFSPNYPFDYFFLDENIERLYAKEEQFNRIISSSSAIAIFIACLGLFGLSAFTTEQRTKEIGVRKVLGASISSILILLCRDFLKLVLIAFAVAIPLAYIAMNRWLQDFVYRIEISVNSFVLAGSFAILLALATVSYQSIKSAMADPVETLRYE